MSNYLTTTREALNAWLQADETLAAHVRTWYLFGETDRQPLDVVGVDCPALEIGPTLQSPAWASNVSQDIEYRLLARLRVKGLDVADAEEFLALFVTAVRRGAAVNFNVPSGTNLYMTNLGQAAFERLAQQSEDEDTERAILRYLGWRVVVPVTLVFRRVPTVANP